MPTNTKYDVMNMLTIDKCKVNYCGKKVKATALPLQVTNLDFLLVDDMFITGAIVILTGNFEADEFKFQVIHPVYGVVNEFIDWFACNINKELSYPAKIFAGLTLRMAYTNNGTQDVIVKINYSLHKILE